MTEEETGDDKKKVCGGFRDCFVALLLAMTKSAGTVPNKKYLRSSAFICGSVLLLALDNGLS
jgi:hypothetical protein